MTRVLIVEDEENIGLLLRLNLKALGFDSVVVNNAFDALKELSVRKFDVLLTDLRMPMMSGIELIPQVRLVDPDLPVIVVTGLKDADTVRKVWREGVVDFITKPFEREELHQAIERALAHRRLHEDSRRENENLEKQLEEKQEMLQRMFTSAVSSLVTAVETRFPERRGHCERVAQLAVDIGKRMGCSEAAFEKLHTAGMLHEAGLLAADSPEPVESETEAQWEKTESILMRLVTDEAVLKSIKHRGERFDGNGKPDRLAGQAIPLGARILAVAIAFDLRARDIREGAPPPAQVVCQEIEMMAGTHFDPSVVDALWFAVDDQQSKQDIPELHSEEIEIVSEPETDTTRASIGL